MAIVITNSVPTVWTLNADGSDKTELAGSNLTKNRIGEYKRVSIFYTAASSLSNVALYFNPALCFNTVGVNPLLNNQPTSYFGYQFGAVVAPGFYTMNLITPLPYVSDLIRNFSIEIEVQSATEFVILLKYYQIYDLDSFFNPSIENNQTKLLVASGLIPEATDTVYSNKDYRPAFYLYAKEVTNPLNYGWNSCDIDGYKAGFYNFNHHNTAPFFTNPEFIYEVTAGVVNELSLTENTKVTFKCDSPTTMTSAKAWLIRTDLNNSTVDFKTNYEASFADIITTGIGVLNNKIVAPATAPFLNVKWTFDFHIDYMQLTIGAKYRVIAIAYRDVGESTNVNSFISEEISILTPTFTGQGYNFNGTLSDYQHEFSGNDLVCIVEERMKSKFNINYALDAFKDDIFNRLGIVVDNDIRRYLTQIKVEVYENQGQTIRHYLARDFANKTSPVLYVKTSDLLELNFTADNLEICYNWRNRYEENIINIESTINGIPTALPLSNQNWANKTLIVRYSLELFYDNYISPFTDNLIFLQTIRPKDYSNDIVIKNEDDTLIDGNTFYLNVGNACLKAELLVPNPEEYNLITTTELEPGTISSIKENETWLGILAQLTSTRIDTQETQYSETELTFAKFCLENSNFNVNLPYKISAIAKRRFTLAKEFEDGIDVQFEDGNIYDFE